jgi:mono/diheme cytochrome c family protein
MLTGGNKILICPSHLKTNKPVMNKINLIALGILGLSVAALADGNQLPPASAKTGVTYATDIKPIFDASCVKCHSGEKPRGRLKLDSLEGALKGGKEGHDVVPGKSADSMLVQMVAHLGDDQMGWMPPVHNKLNITALTPEQIGLIRAWIDQGAK